MMHNTEKRQSGSTGSIVVIAVLAVLGLAVVSFAVFKMLPANKSTAGTAGTASKAAGTGCVTQTLVPGSSGHCVSDIQNLINFMETGGLTQCPFPQAARLTVSGTYDTATQTQVAAVQSWVNCYNKEEGNSAALSTSGTTDPATWSQLCVYGYRLPGQAGQSQSPYFQAAQAAGKDAGC
jgi:hypothetical protein